MDSGLKLYVYVLVLKNIDCFYVGTTKNLSWRIKNHCDGNGGVVTKRYGVKGVLSLIKAKGYKELERLEVEIVREMKKLGYLCWGAGWNDPNLTK